VRVVAAPGREFVGVDEFDGANVESRFLPRLPDDRLRRPLAGVGVPARQTPLADRPLHREKPSLAVYQRARRAEFRRDVAEFAG
jgi:hypothetical protein